MALFVTDIFPLLTTFLKLNNEILNNKEYDFCLKKQKDMMFPPSEHPREQWENIE